MTSTSKSPGLFVLLTIGLVAPIPIAASYLVAFALTGAFGSALRIALSGGLQDGPALAATIAFTLTFWVSAAANLPTVLNMDWFWGQPAGQFATIAAPDVGDQVARRVGWFGPLLGAGVVLALEITRVPEIDGAALGRLVAGGSTPGDWLTVLIPPFARSVLGAVAAVVGGSIWSIVLGLDDSG